MPVALVENSGRCATNEGGEKVIPFDFFLLFLLKQSYEIIVNLVVIETTGPS